MSGSLRIRACLLAVLGAVASTPARAQEAKPDTGRIVAARRLLTASGAAELMVTMLKASIPAQRASTPQLPAEFWTRLEQRLVSDAPQLVDSIAVLYATLFTVPELQALTAFYESPSGRRYRDLQPDLVAQSTAIGQRWGARLGAAVGASLQR